MIYIFSLEISCTLYILLTCCCRKTAVCNGINFSIFLHRNSFLANQRLALTEKYFCSNCSAVMGLTPCMLYVQIYLMCIGLLAAEFLTVNTGLGRPMFWKPLCLLSTPEGLATTNCQLT